MIITQAYKKKKHLFSPSKGEERENNNTTFLYIQDLLRMRSSLEPKQRLMVNLNYYKNISFFKYLMN